MTAPVDGLLAKRPLVKDGILLSPELLRGPKTVHVVKDAETGKSFEVGPKEFFVIKRLDGARTLEQIGDEYAAQFGRRLGEASWQQLLGLLYTRHLLAGVPAPASVHHDNLATPTRSSGSGASVLSGKIRLGGDASGWIDRMYGTVRFFFSSLVVVPLLVGAVGMEVVLFRDLGALVEATGRSLREPVSLLVVTLLLWLSAALHELMHGLVAHRYGGIVTEIGLRWRFPLLFLYCKVENYLFLRTRWHQVATAASGVFLNLVFLLPFFAVWVSASPGTTVSDAAGALLLLGSALALLNLLPVPPLDGYKMLSHATGTADYAAHSHQFLLLAVLRVVGRGPGVAAYPSKAKLAYALYGLGLVAVISGATVALIGACHALFADRFGLGAVIAPIVILLLLTAATTVRALAKAGRDQTKAGRHHTKAGRHHTKGRSMSRFTADVPNVGPAIVIDDLRKRYGDVRALGGVSFTVERGEFFGVIGPNGAGKSTLLEIVMGLREADSGSVSVLGQSPWPRNMALIPRIGIQTQSSAFFARLTAREHLQTVASLYGAGRRAVNRVLGLVELKRHANARVDDLSGGQRQRLAIATALIHDPELIFLDEPTAALDPQARRSLWNVLRALKKEGRTIVYTTHHLDEAAALCDRVAILVGGSIVALDSPQNLVAARDPATRLLVPLDRLTVEQAAALDGVDQAGIEGGALVIETRAARQVLAAIDDAVGLHGVQMGTATLEDVYLELAGTEQR